MPRAAAELGAHALLVGGIEHKIKRRLEPVGDFVRDWAKSRSGGTTPTTGVTDSR